jgi:hypothetical protein
MAPDLLFQLINTLVLPAWLLLLFAPRWPYTQTVAFGVTVPVLALTYTALLFRAFGEGGGFSLADFSSLEGVRALLSNDLGLVAGWAHYLAFDLFVGTWIVRDARAQQVPHLIAAVPLLLTFLAGPFGLLLYLIARQIKRRRFLAEPSPFANILAAQAAGVSSRGSEG